MNPTDYLLNQDLFSRFHSLQSEFCRRLADRPEVVRRWLEAQPKRGQGQATSGAASRTWRMARLSAQRRRDLAALLGCAAGPAPCFSPLAAWLLASLPVRSYLEIADFARAPLAPFLPEADRCRERLAALRESIFLANYGLAKAAVRHREREDYGDRLSAASCGLLDAVDRYVPGEKAARFGYFANYWIRYHLSRHHQKYHSLVAFPIHQHRILRRMERLAESAGDQPGAATAPGIPAWDLRPRVVSIHGPVGGDEPDAPTMEHVLHDPAPPPAAVAEAGDFAHCFRVLLRNAAPPATRVMLAAGHGIGCLSEAAGDYLDHLAEQIGERLLRPPALVRTA